MTPRKFRDDIPDILVFETSHPPSFCVGYRVHSPYFAYFTSLRTRSFSECDLLQGRCHTPIDARGSSACRSLDRALLGADEDRRGRDDVWDGFSEFTPSRSHTRDPRMRHAESDSTHTEIDGDAPFLRDRNIECTYTFCAGSHTHDRKYRLCDTTDGVFECRCASCRGTDFSFLLSEFTLHLRPDRRVTPEEHDVDKWYHRPREYHRKYPRDSVLWIYGISIYHRIVSGSTPHLHVVCHAKTHTSSECASFFSRPARTDLDRGMTDVPSPSADLDAHHLETLPRSSHLRSYLCRWRWGVVVD